MTGPTPPGTASWLRRRAGRSPARRRRYMAVHDVMPQSMTTAPGSTMSPERAGSASRHDHDVGARTSPASPVSSMADGDGGVLLEQEERSGLAHHLAAADDHGARATMAMSDAKQDLHRSLGTRRTVALACLGEQSRVPGMDTVDVLGGVERQGDVVPGQASGSGIWTMIPPTCGSSLATRAPGRCRAQACSRAARRASPGCPPSRRLEDAAGIDPRRRIVAHEQDAQPGDFAALAADGPRHPRPRHGSPPRSRPHRGCVRCAREGPSLTRAPAAAGPGTGPGWPPARPRTRAHGCAPRARRAWNRRAVRRPSRAG